MNKKKQVFAVLCIITFLCFSSCLQAAYFYKDQKSKRMNGYIEKSSDISRMIDTNTISLENFFIENIERFDSLSRLSKFFDSPDNEEFLRTNRIRMYEQIQKLPIINELVFYRNVDHRISSTSRANATLQRDNTTGLFISDLYEDIAYIINKQSITEPSYITINTNKSSEENKLIYVHPVLNYNYFHNNSNFILGYAMAFIDKELLFGTLDSITDDNTYISIADRDGYILYESGDYVLSKKLYDELAVTREYGSNIYGHHTVTVYNNNYEAFWHDSSLSGLSNLIYIPSSLAGVSIFGDYSLYIYSELVLIIIITIISIISLLTNEKKSVLSNRTGEQLQTAHDKEIKQLIDILHDNSPADSSLDAIGSLMGINITGEYFSLLLIEPNKTYISGMTYDQSSYLNNMIKSQISECMEKFGVYSISFNDHKTYMTTLANMSEYLDIGSIADTLLNELNKKLPCGFNIYYLPPTDSLNGIGAIYAAMQNALNLSYIYNYSNIISYAQITEYNNKPFFYMPEMTVSMREYLKQGNFLELKARLCEEIKRIKEDGCTYKHIQWFVMQILKEIKEILPARDGSDTMFLCSKPLPEMESSSSLDDYIEHLYAYIDEYSAQTQSKSSSINKNFMEKIREYINHNIESASLTNVAEAFNMSASHLSRLFKETAQINFIEYVSDIKLDKAAHMLQNEPSKNINDIAQQLGYEDPAYFSKKFKAAYDLSPSMYRKTHLMKKDKTDVM